ncbi:MAG: flavin reductase family protein [Thermoprotei archaeon]|nr:MAG: flavin reductase family protein [Thermoprotei archaeon]
MGCTPVSFEELRDLEEFYHMLHPRPVAVVITRCPNGRVNAMPASWVTPVSDEPPVVGVAIGSQAYTQECLECCGEATLNIPGPEHADLVYALGTVSGRDVDKVREFGLRLVGGRRVSVPAWQDAIGVIEGRVRQVVGVGEVKFFLLDVVAAYARRGLMGRWGWDTSRTSPLMHGWGRAFYLVGRRVFAKKR